MVFPLGSPPRRRPEARDADVNVCMYREFGRMLCEELDRPYLQAPDRPALAPRSSCARSASSPALDPEPFIEREKHTTHQADLGSVAQRDPGLLRHRLLRDRRHRDLRARRAALPRGRDGRALRLRLRAPAGRQARQRGGPQGARSSKPPLVLFGSYNERMYAAEQRRRAIYIPASFPGAIIRRAHRHALHGLRRRDLPRPGSTATRCSTRCSTSCRSRPTWTGSSRRRRGSARGTRPWDEEAQALLDELRRGAARSWCGSRPPSGCATRAEREARKAAGEARVTAARVARVLEQGLAA